MCLNHDVSGWAPVVDVPLVKVSYNHESVEVRYVFEVTFMARSWRVERTYLEVFEFAAHLCGRLPDLPDQPEVVGCGWDAVSRHREAMQRFFSLLSRVDAYKVGGNAQVFAVFLAVHHNLYDLCLRYPAPQVLDTTWWFSFEDLTSNLAACGESGACVPGAFAALPEDVVLCTAGSCISQEQNGIRVRVPVPRGYSLQSYDLRLRLAETSVFYGCIAAAAHGGAIPSLAHVMDFMRLASCGVQSKVVAALAKTVPQTRPQRRLVRPRPAPELQAYPEQDLVISVTPPPHSVGLARGAPAFTPLDSSVAV